MEPTNREQQTPEVTEQTPQAKGSFSMQRQTLLVIGVSAILLGAILFSGLSNLSNVKQNARPQVQMPITAANKDSLDIAGRELQDAQNRAVLERDKAIRAKLDYDRMNGQERAGQPVMGPNGIVYQPEPQGPQPVDPIQQKRIEREYESRYASSVAFSYQSSTPTTEAKPAVVSPPPTPAAGTAPAPAEKPSAPTYKLFEATILEAVLVNRLEGGFVGPVLCMLTNDVYSRDGQTLLIKKGSKVIGEAKRVTEQYQQRLAVVFHRLIMPDGYSVNLDQVGGLDQGGETALRDKTDHHYLATFGTSAMLGLLAGFSMYGTGGILVSDGPDIYRQGVSRQLGSDATQILNRQLNRLPDIQIREGHRVRLMLSRDLDLPAYSQHGAPVQ